MLYEITKTLHTTPTTRRGFFEGYYSEVIQIDQQWQNKNLGINFWNEKQVDNFTTASRAIKKFGMKRQIFDYGHEKCVMKISHWLPTLFCNLSIDTYRGVCQEREKLKSTADSESNVSHCYPKSTVFDSNGEQGDTNIMNLHCAH